MKKEKFDGTVILAIIDRSGSMSTIKNDAIGGFNTFLNDQKNIEGKCMMSIALFDTEYDLIAHGEDIKNIEELNDKTFVPRGSTALYDAIGKGVHQVESMQIEADRYLCVILTDGEENASREFTRENIFKLIEEKRKGDWEFIFLAANQDAMQAGQSMGMSTSNSMCFAATADGTNNAYATISKGTSNYRGMSKEKLYKSKSSLLND